MRRFKYTFIGFLLFVVSISLLLSIGIVIFSYIENENRFVIALLLLLFILISAAFCTVFDYVRRKIMIEQPLNEILEVTKLMARGNFKVRLKTKHAYNDYDAYDMIKEDLNKMAKELSKSEMLKNDFIANVSHEIKTPLAVINSYAKVLSDSSISEDERKKYLHNLQLSCNKLNTLVTNILKLNKLENQKLLPEFTSFNLSELLSDQILQFEELLEKKNIELICDIEDDLMINSEKNYLEIVFNNLMSNAIKFSHNSGIINISLKKQDDKYTIIFKDNGCGMDSETGKHIFDKFYQADTSHSKEGNGLGLALVKKVIDIIGGKISVESEIGVGTTFTIVIKGV